MKIKKFISLLASLAMMVTAVTGVMSVSAETDTGSCGDDITWNFNTETGVLTLSGEGRMEARESIYTSHTHWSYSKYDNQIKEVIVEEGITQIGNCAFGAGSLENSCVYPNLTKVTLPSTLTYIGGCAFKYDNIEKINIPNSVNFINEGAFAFTSLKEINLNEGMYIGGGVFFGCESLKEVTIPPNCTYGKYGFQGGGRREMTFARCIGLEKVEFDNGVTDLFVQYMFGECTALKDVYFYTTDLQSIVGSNTPYVENSYTFPTYKNINFHVIKGSTTEQTLKGAGYLTDDNTVYLADTTALETAIADAETIETDKYTDESVSAFTEALENAKALLDNMNATQEEVDKAVQAIEDSKTALTEKPDEPSSSDPSDSSDPSNSSGNNNQSQSPNTPATPPTAAPTTATPKPTTPPTVTTTAAKPAKVKAVEVKAKKKKLNVSWKKVSGATGYEVLCATNNKFTKGKKSFTVKKNKVTLKKLKPKKKYFIKVRAYKLANGRKYFGKWSKVVKKKVR